MYPNGFQLEEVLVKPQLRHLLLKKLPSRKRKLKLRKKVKNINLIHNLSLEPEEVDVDMGGMFDDFWII